jgi:hypothetical protein
MLSLRRVWVCGRMRRLPVLLVLLPLLAACGRTYYAAEDAPDFIKQGGLDLRVVASRVFGPPLSPIVRNIRFPYGRLHGREGLERFLQAELKPLDIILVRSRPALTRTVIPSHFTHGLVWLGTASEMKRTGVWDIAELAPYRDEMLAGKTVIEAAGNSVHLSPLAVAANVDEIAILRPTYRGTAWAREKYAALFARTGVDFDYNFDASDRSRLTCVELVAEVFPEFALPVRYSLGRYAIVPDDLVRIAIDGSPHLSFRHHVSAPGRDGFATAGAAAAEARLTTPREAR